MKPEFACILFYMAGLQEQPGSELEAEGRSYVSGHINSIQVKNTEGESYYLYALTLCCLIQIVIRHVLRRGLFINSWCADN